MPFLVRFGTRFGGPRAAQERPRAAKIAPRASQELPERGQEHAKSAHRALLFISGAILRAKFIVFSFVLQGFREHRVFVKEAASNQHFDRNGAGSAPGWLPKRRNAPNNCIF